MPKTRKPYHTGVSRATVALVRAGRTPEDLAREFEPPAGTHGQLPVVAIVSA